MSICLTSGSPTLIAPRYINILDNGPTNDNEINIHQLEDHQVFLQGDFTGFHTYLIVTHTKFSITRDSLKKISTNEFSAEINYEIDDSEVITKIVTFYTPLNLPFEYVNARKFGREYNSFEFKFIGTKEPQSFTCDLSFMIHCSKSSNFLIPLEIKYIGMAAKNGRTAQERLGKGHEKLQTVLAELNSKDQFKSASLVLYKPGKLNSKDITFEETVETLEASLIQYFKPKPLNKEHLNFPNNKTKLTMKLKYFGINQVLTVIESPKKTRLSSKYLESEQCTHTFFVNIP